MSGARILMVEDEADVLSVNLEHFTAQGYEVHCAKTLREARAVIYEYPPDLILLDVLMPDGSGYDFCKEIRAYTGAAIMYLTCMGRDEDMIRGLMEGGDDYLSKPYSLDVLSTRVVAALRRIGIVNAGRIEKPPLIIDHLSGRVTIDEKELFLSQKEKQLLSFLVCHAGREFGAAEISDSVWGGSGSGSTVRSHISNLRKKLEDTGDFFEIILTPSRKYMFMQLRYI